MTHETSRRRFLAATAAVGTVAGLNVAVLGQDTEESEYILLGGFTPGWLGFQTPAAEGDGTETTAADDGVPQNPTWALEPGTTYTVLWRNVDGQPHNFAIHDEDGERLQVLMPIEADVDQFEALNGTSGNETEVAANETTVAGNETAGNETTVPEEELIDITETMSEEGAVQGVQFTATEEMARYICEVHPTTMVGDIEIVGGDGGTENNSSG